MKRYKTIAAVAAGMLAFSSVNVQAGPSVITHVKSHAPAAIWAVFGCTGGVVIAALAANYAQRRQLTWNEAASCGLLFWLTPPPKRP